MLPISRIYVDTTYKTADSVSSSDFKIELPETLALPPNTKAYLTDITMVNTMTTIIKDCSDKFYWCKVAYNKIAQPFSRTFGYFRIVVQEGSYTASSLREYLHTELNRLEQIPKTVNVSGFPNTNSLIISRNN